MMISQRRLGVIGFVLIAVLGLPREGSAGLAELIWQLSGPQLTGVVVAHCKVGLEGATPECRLFEKRTSGDVNASAALTYWLSLEGGIYWSTPRDTNNRYGWFDVWMLAVEPIFEVRSTTRDNFRVYHGAGLAYNRLFGEGFSSFNKVALKLRPLAVEFPLAAGRLNVAYNLRLYPDEFTDADFGFGPRVDTERPSEAVHGFSIGFHF